MTTRQPRRRFAILAVLALVAGILVSVPVVGSAQDTEDAGFVLTILHNNDGESKLLPDDGSDPGVARFVALMKQLQAAAAGQAVVTLTSGDNFLASQEFGVSLAREGPLYDSVALSGVYDAMALGNHDFDMGPEVTSRFIKGFEPAIPFLSANLDFSGEPGLQALVDEGLIAASTVIETGGVRVGVIGAVTPLLPNISSPRNVVVSPVLPAVQAEVTALEAQGVNVVVLVSHLQDVAEEIELVASLSGVDVVIAGGGDDLLRNEGDTCLPDEEAVAPYPIMVEDAAGTMVPVITAPGGYRCIGVLDVKFDTAGNVVATDGRFGGGGFRRGTRSRCPGQRDRTAVRSSRPHRRRGHRNQRSGTGRPQTRDPHHGDQRGEPDGRRSACRRHQPGRRVREFPCRMWRSRTGEVSATVR